MHVHCRVLPSPCWPVSSFWATLAVCGDRRGARYQMAYCGCGGRGVAAVAAVASYERAYLLVRAYGEAGWTGRPGPLTVNGSIYASSTVMLDSARGKTAVLAAARWLMGLGIVATLAAVTRGVLHRPTCTGRESGCGPR
jgi:hypothetical protein